MSFYEKMISSEEVYKGKIITVRRDTVELDNGHPAMREVVEHTGGVGIVAIDGDGSVLLVRQFRYPMSEEIVEIPAGKLEAGEKPYDCAVRELSEETGCTAGKIISLGDIYPSPGYCREILYVFLAMDLIPGKDHLDYDEFVEVERMPFSEAVDMAASGELSDAKTVIGLMRARHYLEKIGDSANTL